MYCVDGGRVGREWVAMDVSVRFRVCCWCKKTAMVRKMVPILFQRAIAYFVVGVVMVWKVVSLTGKLDSWYIAVERFKLNNLALLTN